MKAEEKAKEIYYKFFTVTNTIYKSPSENKKLAKSCAYIFIDEILSGRINSDKDALYWIDVKSAIDKL